MIARVQAGALSGSLRAMPSKSSAHRLLICAALGKTQAQLLSNVFSKDIEATVRCLNALCAEIREEAVGILVRPADRPQTCVLDPGESGSTYRFLAPVACAVGKEAEFHLSGKLPQRPMDALWKTLRAHGAVISGEGESVVRISGPITPGAYEIPGDISSQFLSGLLFALPLLHGDSDLIITGTIQSKGYLDMTLQALSDFRIDIRPTETGYHIPGNQTYVPPRLLHAEGDWSNAGFWLCAAAVKGEGLTLSGLRPDSLQADKAVCDILERFGAAVTRKGDTVTVRPGTLKPITVDGTHIPDLIPALAITAAGVRGDTVFENIARLRIKESDRVASVVNTIRALGGSADSTENTITVHGTGRLAGGTVDSCNDHRIAMMAACAAVLCDEPVTITDAQAVAKSYPNFYEHFAHFGGAVRKEQL